jgi:hypothetical protein
MSLNSGATGTLSGNRLDQTVVEQESEATPEGEVEGVAGSSATKNLLAFAVGVQMVAGLMA